MIHILYYICICKFVCVHACVCLSVYIKVRGQLMGVSSLLHYVVPDQTQVFRLGNKSLNWLSHLFGPDSASFSYYYFFVLSFKDKLSLCSLDCPGTHNILQTAFKPTTSCLSFPRARISTPSNVFLLEKPLPLDCSLCLCSLCPWIKRLSEIFLLITDWTVNSSHQTRPSVSSPRS